MIKLKTKNKLGKLLYDLFMTLFPVMMGVYLGIYFNNENEEEKREQLIRNIKLNLLIESQENLKVLEESKLYFSMLRDSLFRLQNEKTSPSELSFWKGMNPPENLSDNAYTVAQLTNSLSSIEINDLLLISKIYKSIDNLSRQSDSYVQSVTNRIGTKDFTNEFYIDILLNYSYDQLVTEHTLISDIKRLIVNLKTS